ncbi:MAG TPA: DUF1571 domain-containing protein [Dictyoglomaceae bacterium]|nr:DUF1571 domain-containing protein [Dictyoglomaceae bacterium]HOL39014.1 DUF1571 domain-containing protein [Dictyoglomaceae bacterium]HOP94353.1 DUF1571 domain-containing protein [Dictyoglomaceae bacterium]HPP15810.1 DUF1571 domain-containing protein [Dictyoglomaceae bacterium]HPU42799.1 DUF1571 domain-containing protein [Dictyoglomaceae bacterium]
MRIWKFLLIFLLFISSSFGISTDEILQKTKVAYNNINTFYSILEVYNRDANSEENITYEFFFQKPNTIRLNIVDGKDKGTVLIYKEGKVRLKRGGVLSFIPISLNPDDPLILSLRKGRVDELSIAYVLEQLFKNKPLLVKEANINGYNCFVIEINTSRDRLYTYTMQRVYIDKDNFIPIQLEQYENYQDTKILVHKRTYKNYQINPNFDSQIFNI